MNCQRARSAISLFLDDRLDPAQQARLNRHLESCEDCSAYLEDLREGLTALRNLPLAEPSANFEWNLRRKLQDAITEQKLLAKHASRSAFWPRFSIAAAATILLCLGAASLWFSNLDHPPLSPVLDRPMIAESGESLDGSESLDSSGNNATRRILTESGVPNIAEPVGGSESRRTPPRQAETIRPADPNVRFPLEENARAQSAEDSLDAREDTRP